MKKTLTVIVDNYRYDPSLETDWGFSALLDVGGTKILFDLGNNPEIFARNVERLGIDLSEVECLVISHYDEDHIGGLWYFLEKNKDATIYVPYDPGGWDLNRRLREEYKRNVIDSSFPKFICRYNLAVYVTGTMSMYPRPEQALYVLGVDGWSILAGCSHPGPWEVAKYVKGLNYAKEIDMYIGGFHMYRMSEKEIKKGVRKVIEERVKKVGPCHCTGDEAREMFRWIYDEDFIEVGVGRVIEWY